SAGDNRCVFPRYRPAAALSGLKATHFSLALDVYMAKMASHRWTPLLQCDVGCALPEQGQLMIGLVLVTHGKLAEEFRHALEHVVCPQKHIETVSIGPEGDMDQRRQDIVDAGSVADDGHGGIILPDMFGG